MYVASGEFDLLLLPQLSSLKDKRAVVRPLVAELRRRFDVAAAEVGESDLHERAVIGAAAVSNSADHARHTMNACEDWLSRQPAADLLSAAIRVYRPSEDFPAS